MDPQTKDAYRKMARDRMLHVTNRLMVYTDAMVLAASDGGAFVQGQIFDGDDMIVPCWVYVLASEEGDPR